MKPKNFISVKRMIELESWLYNNYKKELNMDLFNCFSSIELAYLRDAYCMPYSIVSECIDTYDTTTPKMDELKFINDLQKKFGITKRDDILKRIRNIRRIKKYCSENNYILSIPTTKEHNKLVRNKK